LRNKNMLPPNCIPTSKPEKHGVKKVNKVYWYSEKDTPKKHAEQDFCTKLQLWLKYNMLETCFIEAKVSYKPKFNLNSGFKDHQLPCLSQIKHGAFAYKISDLDRMQKPLDIVFAYQARTYVAIMWVRRGNKTFYLLDPDTIQGLKDDGFISISEEQASILALEKGELRS